MLYTPHILKNWNLVVADRDNWGRKIPTPSVMQTITANHHPDDHPGFIPLPHQARTTFICSRASTDIAMEMPPAISYTERLLHANPSTRTLQVYPKTRRATNNINESKILAETATAKAESKDSNLRAEAHKQAWDESSEGDEGDDWSSKGECAKVMRELELIKQEVSQLKLDMASVLEEKRRADEQRDSSLLRSASSYLSSAVEKLNREVEEINEKHVLVELARIEAVKEYEQVEAQRTDEVERYVAKIEEARKKKEDMVQEIEDAIELENKLAVTILDVSMLSSKLKQVKEDDKGLEKNETWRNKVKSDDIQDQDQDQDKSGSASLLHSVMKKLEAAKKELNSIKEESFQFMTSMDIVRNERRQVGVELAKITSKEKKSEIAIEKLKSKLLRAKVKLEAAAAAEDKAKSMASNISATLEQLRSEAEAAKKEKSLISEETAILRAEIQSTESEMYLAEEQLRAAQDDLTAAKSAEATALENLKSLTEKTMRNRASSSRPSSRITISRFEYEYLIGHAAGATEIADKKVAATQAWVEALKASEKEIQIKCDLLRRESRELEVEEQHATKRTMSLRRMAEDDLAKWRQSMEHEKQKPDIALPRKAMNRSVKMSPARRGKARAIASPLVRGTPRSTSVTIRRRRKSMPNLAKFFSRKSTERHP